MILKEYLPITVAIEMPQFSNNLVHAVQNIDINNSANKAAELSSKVTKVLLGNSTEGANISKDPPISHHGLSLSVQIWDWRITLLENNSCRATRIRRILTAFVAFAHQCS